MVERRANMNPSLLSTISNASRYFSATSTNDFIAHSVGRSAYCVTFFTNCPYSSTQQLFVNVQAQTKTILSFAYICALGEQRRAVRCTVGFVLSMVSSVKDLCHNFVQSACNTVNRLLFSTVIKLKFITI